MGKPSKEAQAVAEAVLSAKREQAAPPAPAAANGVIPEPALPETVAPRRERAGHIVLPLQTDPPERWPASFDVQSDEGKARAMNAAVRPDLEIDPEHPFSFHFTDWLIMPESQVDEDTGEVSEYLSLIFFLPGGQRVKTTGRVVMERLAKWLACWPGGEWRNLEVTIFVLNSRKNKAQTYHEATVRWMPLAGA